MKAALLMQPAQPYYHLQITKRNAIAFGLRTGDKLEVAGGTASTWLHMQNLLALQVALIERF